MFVGKKKFIEKDDGKYTLSMEINGKQFEELPLDPKLCRKCDKCDLYWHSSDCDASRYGCITKYDCKKRRRSICEITNIFFYFLAFFITAFIYIYPLPISFVNKVICHLGLIFALYGINALVDFIQPKFWNKKFYRKAKKLRRKQIRNKAKQEKARLQKEKIQKENLEKLQREQKELVKEPIEINPRIVYARSLVIQIDKLNSIYDFKSNKEKLEKCIQKLNDILFLLECDNSYYTRVKLLFELYLPEVYDSLNYYKKYIEKDVVTESREKSLTIMIDNLLNYLSSQELDAVLSTNEIDIKFNTAIATLNKYFGEGDN